MNKSYYRDLFRELQPFLKMSAFCRIVNINPSTLSLFMRSPDNDYMISSSKLAELENAIVSFLNQFA